MVDPKSHLFISSPCPFCHPCTSFVDNHEALLPRSRLSLTAMINWEIGWKWSACEGVSQIQLLWLKVQNQTYWVELQEQSGQITISPKPELRGFGCVKIPLLKPTIWWWHFPPAARRSLEFPLLNHRIIWPFTQTMDNPKNHYDNSWQLAETSGQITTIPKPECFGDFGDTSLTKLPFKVTNRRWTVAIICRLKHV